MQNANTQFVNKLNDLRWMADILYDLLEERLSIANASKDPDYEGFYQLRLSVESIGQLLFASRSTAKMALSLHNRQSNDVGA